MPGPWCLHEQRQALQNSPPTLRIPALVSPSPPEQPVLCILDAKGGVVWHHSGFLSGSLGGMQGRGMIGLSSGNNPHARVTSACKAIAYVLSWDCSCGNKAQKKQVSREEVIEDAGRFPALFSDLPRPDEECCSRMRPVHHGATSPQWQPVNTQTPPRSPLAYNLRAGTRNQKILASTIRVTTGSWHPRTQGLRPHHPKPRSQRRQHRPS
jgi:hypothetical protein